MADQALEERRDHIVGRVLRHLQDICDLTDVVPLQHRLNNLEYRGIVQIDGAISDIDVPLFDGQPERMDVFPFGKEDKEGPYAYKSHNHKADVPDTQAERDGQKDQKYTADTRGRVVDKDVQDRLGLILDPGGNGHGQQLQSCLVDGLFEAALAELDQYSGPQHRKEENGQRTDKDRPRKEV